MNSCNTLLRQPLVVMLWFVLLLCLLRNIMARPELVPSTYCGLSSSDIARISRSYSDPIFGLDHLYNRLGLPYNRSEPTIPTSVSTLQSVNYFLICDDVEVGSLPTELGLLPNLRSMIMYYSPVVTGIPSQLGNLSSLTNLAIYNGRDIKEVPTQLGLLSGLRSLGLERFQQLQTLPTEIFSIPELRLLHVMKSRLKFIPPEVKNLHKLSRLRLWEIEGFQEIATQIGELKSLKTLQLNQMKLRSLPSEAGGMENLEELVLYQNPTLTELPSQVGRLAKLTFLSLSAAGISELPDVFDAMTELREMWLSSMTNLRSTPPSLILGKNKLSTLELHRSMVEDLPEGLMNLSSSLTTFGFGHAWPEVGQVEVNKIWKLTKLKWLAVDGKHIKRSTNGEIESIFSVSSDLGNLRQLTSLAIEHSDMTRLPESIARLDKLTSLSLWNNQKLDRLPIALKTLPALERIGGTFAPDCTCPLLDWVHPDIFPKIDLEASICASSPEFESEYDGRDVGRAYLELNTQTNTNGAPCLAVDNVTYSITDNETSAAVRWDYEEDFYFDPLFLQVWEGQGCYNCSGYKKFYGDFSDNEIADPTLGFVIETSFAFQDDRSPQWIDRVCCYGGTRSFTLENLYPFSTYNVKIRSANLLYVNPVFTATLGRNVWEINARFGPWHQYKVQTGEAIPWDAPLGIGATEVRESSFILTWQPPTNANGVITAYHVQINNEEVSVLAGNDLFLQVFDRQPAESMNVSVRAHTRLGVGPWGSIHVRTLATCPAGQYRLSKGRGVYLCEPCPINTYRDLTLDGASCMSCPDNRPYTNGTGTASIHQCMAVRGSFFDVATGMTSVCDPDCMDCPQGTLKETIIVKDGCWRWGVNTSLVEACPRQEFCVASEAVGGSLVLQKNATRVDPNDLFAYTEYCKEGHTGLYCSTCLDGFGMGPEGCEKCATHVTDRHQNHFAWAVTGICLVSLFCLILLHVYIHYPFCKSKKKQAARELKRKQQRQQRSVEEEEARKQGLMQRSSFRKFLFTEASTVFYKVLIGFFQVADAFVSVVSDNRVARHVVVAYNGDFDEISQGLGLINLSIELNWVEAGCWMRLSHFEKLLFHCLVPIAFICVMWLSYACVRFFPNSSEARIARAWRGTLNATAVVILVLYPTRNLLILQSFQCRDVGGGRASVLRADPSIDCASEGFDRVRTLAISMVVLWTVLPPFLVGFILTKYERDTEAMFNASYRPGCMLYEVVDMIRKLVQVCVVVAFAVPLEALFFSFLACLIFIVMFAIVRPFKDGHDNYLAICAQAALLLVVLIEVVYLANFEGVEWWHIRSVMVATLVVVPMACALFFLCIFSAKLRESVRPEQNDNTRVFSGRTSRRPGSSGKLSEGEVLPKERVKEERPKEIASKIRQAELPSANTEMLEGAQPRSYRSETPEVHELKVEQA